MFFVSKLFKILLFQSLIDCHNTAKFFFKVFLSFICDLRVPFLTVLKPQKNVGLIILLFPFFGLNDMYYVPFNFDETNLINFYVFVKGLI